MNPFLVVFSDGFGNADTVRTFVDQRDEFTSWYRCFPNAYLIVSTLDLAGTHQLFEGRFGRNRLGARFLIVLLSQEAVRGQVPLDAWQLILSPDKPEVPPTLRITAALVVAKANHYVLKPSLRKAGPNKVEVTLKAPDRNVDVTEIITRSALETLQERYPETFAEAGFQKVLQSTPLG
jgi:hypothetical protein